MENIHKIAKSSQLKLDEKLISENELSSSDLILPLFVTEGKNKVEKINSMEGVFRYSVDKLDSIMKKVKKQKFQWLHFFHIFLKIKRQYGSEALMKIILFADQLNV